MIDIIPLLVIFLVLEGLTLIIALGISDRLPSEKNIFYSTDCFEGG